MMKAGGLEGWYDLYYCHLLRSSWWAFNYLIDGSLMKMERDQGMVTDFGNGGLPSYISVTANDIAVGGANITAGYPRSVAIIEAIQIDEKTSVYSGALQTFWPPQLCACDACCTTFKTPLPSPVYFS
jgi:hypothetical protein